MSERISRTRNYTSIVYPESAPENWLDILRDYHVGALVSPLHEFDVNRETGELKKPHYHVIIVFDSVKTLAQAESVFHSFNAGVLVQPVIDLTTYARYLCHMDDPDKYRYSESDILQIGGINYYDIIERVGLRYETIHDIEEFCRQEHILSYSRLCDITYVENPAWYKMIHDSCSISIMNYLKGLAWEGKE